MLRSFIRGAIRGTAATITAALLVLAGVALAGCGSGGSAGPGASSAPAAGGTSASAPQGSGGAGTDLFPAAVGDTWVYDVTIVNFGHGTTTNKVASVVPVAAGQRVTITSRTQVPKLPSAPTTLIYVIHPDGTIAVPLAQVGNGVATLRSGSIVWPSKAELDSGQPHTSTLVLGITAAGRTLTVRAKVTVRGGGTQRVTVPAGTYTATVVDQAITEKVQGIPVRVMIRTWLAPGVGPVKETASTTTGTVAEVVSTEVLRSFTRG